MLSRLVPKSLEGQLVAVVALSLVLLLTVLGGFEITRQNTTIEWAESDFILDRLRTMRPVLAGLNAEQAEQFLAALSSCHKGSTVTPEPFPIRQTTAETDRLGSRIARELGLDPTGVRVGYASLTREDFSYAQCGQGEFDFPIEGIVISVGLPSGLWLNAEVHPHQWHTRHITDWLRRSSIAFLVVGGGAILLMRRLSRPLRELTGAARKFGKRLETSEVEAGGPPDLRAAIQAFNAMQRDVTGEVQRRADTLAAVSHDIRTPLTALRIKAELIDDVELRDDLVKSIDDMKRMAVSAIDFLKGESRAEPMRRTDLGALVRSECDNFADLGENVTFNGEGTVFYRCRPDALARAVRNLIENATKYGGGATVELRSNPDRVEIAVADTGPGIPKDKIEQALEPFERISKAREPSQGGFGLGLAIVKAICEGHDGELVLANNDPAGCVATIRLPARSVAPQS